MGRLVTAGEIAARLRVPRSWVYRAAREGDLPSVRCGRYRRFDVEDVNRWIEDQKQRSYTGTALEKVRGVRA